MAIMRLATAGVLLLTALEGACAPSSPPRQIVAKAVRRELSPANVFGEFISAEAAVEAYRRLTVEVRDEAGRPQPGATIEVLAMDRRGVRISGEPAVWYAAIRALTGTAGTVSLAVPEGELRLVATRGSYVGVLELGDDAPGKGTVALHAVGVLEGVVVDDSGRPVPGARVWPSVDCREPLARTKGELDYFEADPRRLSAVEGPAAQLTDRDGMFSLRLRREGLACVLVSTSDGQVGASSEVQVLARSRVRVAVQIDSGRPLRGQVVDAGGRPVAGARVTVRERAVASRPVGAEGQGAWGSEATTSRDGTFKVTVPREASYLVRATHPAFADAAVIVEGPEALEPVVVLPSGGRVRARIDASALRRALREDRTEADADLVVEIEPAREDLDYRSAELTLDERGRADVLVGGLEPGPYRVAAIAHVFAAHSPVFVVSPRRTPVVDLRLGADAGSLEGVVDGLPDIAARGGHVLAVNGKTRASAAIEAGTFVFRVLPAGKWTLLVGGPSWAPSEQGMLLAGRAVAEVEPRRATHVTIAATLVPAAPQPHEAESPVDLSHEEMAHPGLELRSRPGRVVIAGAEPENAETREGDELVLIEGIAVADIVAAANLLTGARGTPCRMRLFRPATGASFDLTLPRSSPGCVWQATHPECKH